MKFVLLLVCASVIFGGCARAEAVCMGCESPDPDVVAAKLTELEIERLTELEMQCSQ